MSTEELGKDEERPELSIGLFGPVELRLGEEPLPHCRTRKGEWLLALLVLRHPQQVERSWLAGTLWPDSGESQAQASLRQSLSDLRRVLGTEAARLQTPTLTRLVLDLSGARADVLDFDRCISKGDAASLEQAVGVYRGTLLEGCTEEWVYQERTAREEAFLTALERLAAHATAQRDPAAAARHLRRVIGVDPLRETAQRGLMQALAATGNYAAATIVYRDLRIGLHRELNAEPDPQTRALYEEIRAEARRKATTPREAAPRPAVVPASAAPLVEEPSEPEAEDGGYPLPALGEGGVAGAPPLPRIPQPITDFVGREQELAQLHGLVRRARLVTLTGPGGVGKTRLAIQAASRALDDFPGRVVFVDLSPLRDPLLVSEAVADLLGASDRSSRSLDQALVEAIDRTAMLLVLDNCEHLLEAAAALADLLLRSCPNLRVLATSREALGLTGERTFPVPSLSMPPASSPTADPGTTPAVTAEELLRFESIRLFVERAVAVRPTFALDERNAPAVVEVCRRLDGIPLALELAAARLKGLAVAQLAERLGNRFQILTSGSRAALPRQQTLRATLDWSFELLPDPERVLLRRLSVFAGNWSLEAAECVCGSVEVWKCGSGSNPHTSTPPHSHTRIQPADVLDLLSSLVSKSLVALEETDGEVRYRLLETTREYSASLLEASGEAAGLQDGHAAYFGGEVAAGVAALQNGDRAGVERMRRDHDNYRAALEWLTREGGAPRDREQALKLAADLAWFWEIMGYVEEGRRWLTLVISQSPAPSPVKASALCGLGGLCWHAGDGEAARRTLTQAIETARQTGERAEEAHASSRLGRVMQDAGELAEARQLLEGTLAYRQEVGDARATAYTLRLLANLSLDQADHAAADRDGLESLKLYRECGDQVGAGRALTTLCLLNLHRRDLSAARAYGQEAREIWERLGYANWIAWSWTNLADVELEDGRVEVAEQLYSDGVRLFRDLHSRVGVADSLRGLATVTAARAELGATVSPEQVRTAALLFGAHDAMREASHYPLPEIWRPAHEPRVAVIRRMLGDEVFAAASAEGRRLTATQAIALATAAVRGAA